ncbi:MAG: hypothetical protein EOO97_00930, partial [Pedobacter sp.]
MKYSKIGSLLLAGFVLLTSCKKDLDQQPTAQFNEANAFLTVADIRAAANTGYSRLGGAVADDMYANSLVSDEAKLGAGNAGQGALEYRYEYRSDNTTGSGVFASFGSYYSVIQIANIALPKIATVAGSGSDAAERDNLRAQFLTMRAFSYLGLLESFSKVYDPAALGVPLVTSYNPLERLPRNTMGEVMSQIQADLTEAKTLFPAASPADYIDTTFNSITVSAIQARTALFRKDYDAAITFSTEVINSGIKPLVSGSDYAGIWADVLTNPNEVLFKSRLRYGSALTTSGGTIYIAPSDKLRATYSPLDVRGDVFIGQNSNGDYYVKKFFPAAYMKPIRTAEMYLIRAEANA